MFLYELYTFLSEYTQEKTTEVLGSKLIDALLKDTNVQYGILSQAREIILRSINPIPSSNVEAPPNQESINKVKEQAIRQILQVLEDADPTPNKQYTTWLARCYATQGIKLEDLISNGADWLETYHKMKQKNILPIEQRDINRIKFKDLWNIVGNNTYLYLLNKGEEEKLPKGDAKELLNNNAVRIIQPLDEDAAKYYGNGTQWCTAANKNNMFDNYVNDGALYILIPKKAEHQGEKYQIHPNSGQFMDERDDPVDAYNLLSKRFGNLIPFFKQLEPELGKLVVFADNEVLNKALLKIEELAIDFISDFVQDWQDQDDSYATWLIDNGHVITPEKVAKEQKLSKKQGVKPDYTEDNIGDIDWENAPGYFEYNSEAEDIYDSMIEAVGITPNQAKGYVGEFQAYTGEDSVLLTDLEALVAFIVQDQTGSRDEKEVFSNLVDWINKNIVVSETGEVKKFNSRKNDFD